jgi:hypothetical protein
VPNPGYVSALTSATYYFGGRGTLRTDNILRTDFSVNYKIKAGPVEFFLQPEIINLFNRKGLVGFDEEVLTALDTGSGLKPFNPFTETPVEGVNWAKGPNFGKAAVESDYQTPRTFRFSVGVRF